MTAATLRFGITYDYLCPFGRNGNEHVVAGLRSGATWDVEFVPYSLSQAKSAEAGDVRWDGAAALRRSGVLALAVAEIVRAEQPERFVDVHLELFALRHDRAEDLRDPGHVAGALERAGVASELVDRAEQGLPALQAAHEAMVAREVWGVPTLLGTRRAVFVRLLDRPGDVGAESAARIERMVALVEDDLMLHEFKQVDLPR
jgi:hypothetical protein